MKKIFIIEDDIDILEIISVVFEESGFIVLKSQKKIPIEKIQKANPDIIILDYFLSNGFGNEICLKIKSNPSLKHIPVILMSASYDVEQIAVDCLADAFIPKPFDIYHLEKTIKGLLLKLNLN